MLAVADTSALVALAACDTLPILDRLFTTLVVPEAVARECLVPGKPQAETLEGFLLGKVVEVEAAALDQRLEGIGQGELESIVLCRQLGADLLIVDDHRARRAAKACGIQVTGSLGILLRAKELGLIDGLAPLVPRLRGAGLRFSENLLRSVLQRAGEG